MRTRMELWRCRKCGWQASKENSATFYAHTAVSPNCRPVGFEKIDYDFEKVDVITAQPKATPKGIERTEKMIDEKNLMRAAELGLVGAKKGLAVSEWAVSLTNGDRTVVRATRVCTGNSGELCFTSDLSGSNVVQMFAPGTWLTVQLR